MSTSLLDAVEVRSPCLAAWDAMTGDDRVRHCTRCRQNVYNLSGMTRREAESLLQEHGVSVCVRYYRRADGTVVTGDCSSKVSSLLLHGIASAMTFIIVLLGLLFAFSSQGPTHGHGVRAGFPAPLREVLEWLDPSPPIIMGKLCPPRPPAFPPGQPQGDEF